MKPNEPCDIKITFVKKITMTVLILMEKVAHRFYPGANLAEDLHYDDSEFWSEKPSPQGITYMFSLSMK